MIQHAEGIRRIEREAMTALGRVNLTHWDWAEPIDFFADPNPQHYWLELKLHPTPDDGRACFVDRWSRNRFEPLGRAFLVPASQAVHFKCNCRQSSSVTFALQPEAIQRWFDGELEWTDRRLKQSLDVANPAVLNLLFRLSEELRTPNLASETLIELIAAEIVIELARYCLGSEERRTPGALASWRMRLINERLAETGERPSLVELADLCNLSPRQLTRAFRNSTGCSIGTFVVQNRIDHARRLLRTDQNVKSIAHALGFNSPSHFYVAFHRLTGETPRHYRQRVRRAEGSAS
jgi:AraC family transcriptional regulator